jgi:predicted ATP-grasp superfamily ATP-dependent carboligase
MRRADCEHNMTSTPPVVVIGDHTQGLSIARSAGAAGAAVWIVNDRHVSVTRFSRLSRHVTAYRKLRRGTLEQLDQPAYAAHLRDTLLELPFAGRAVLFGVNEDVTRFIYENRAILRPRYAVPGVRLDAIYDKFRFIDLVPEAARIETRLCSETDLDALAPAERFILKGRSGNAFRRLTGHKAIPVSRVPASKRAALFSRLAPNQVMVQPIIKTTKPVVSVCTFSVSGHIKGVFGYEKLRQHPEPLGTGTYLRSVDVNGLLPLAEHIVKHSDFTGVSEIEFIHDQEAGVYRAIEMNPRAWKSVHFATLCGENLIGRYLRHVAGAETDSCSRFEKDRYWADLAMDLLHMVHARRIGTYRGRIFECVWDRTDPLPAAVLWTLFPVILLEYRLGHVPRRPHAIRAPARKADGRRQVSGEA